MNEVLMRKVDVAAGYAPLAVAASGTPTVFSVTISASPANSAVVYFLGDDGLTDVPWVAGEWHTFQSVDLSKIYVKGTVGDTLTLIGGTW
jgi:hypothetical protein